MFDFQEFPNLETERLYLRQIALSDADAVFAIRGDYEVTKNFGEVFTERKQAEELIQSHLERFAKQETIWWGISLKPDTTIIGAIVFFQFAPKDKKATVGIELNRNYWRKGIVSEAIKPAIRFGFEEMGLNRIQADALSDNAASINLLKSVGFREEGLQREAVYREERFRDLVLLSLLKRDWQDKS